jgi:hypothetical protein
MQYSNNTKISVTSRPPEQGPCPLAHELSCISMSGTSLRSRGVDFLGFACKRLSCEAWREYIEMRKVCLSTCVLYINEQWTISANSAYVLFHTEIYRNLTTWWNFVVRASGSKAILKE